MLRNTVLFFSCVCLYDKWCVCVCLCVCVCVFGLIREGIQWEAIDWMDNAECLDLIEKVTDSRKADLPPGTMANHQPECVDPGATLLTLTLLSQSIII